MTWTPRRRLTEPTPVDWTWVECGLPVMQVQLAVPFATLTAFLGGLVRLPFTRVSDATDPPPDVYRQYVPRGLDRSFKSAGGGYTRRGDRLEVYATGAHQSGLSLWGAWSPIGFERKYAQRLLRKLAAGALGPITWDLLDHDYFCYAAFGEDGASLLTYLSPGGVADRQALKASWSRQKTTGKYDATAATTMDELTVILSRGLGSPEPLTGADFDAWLAAQSSQSLPKHVTIHVSHAFPDDDSQALADRLLQAQRRTIWGYSEPAQDPSGPTLTSKFGYGFYPKLHACLT